MPSSISVKLFGIWVACAFAVGIGFGAGQWLVGQVLGVMAGF